MVERSGGGVLLKEEGQGLEYVYTKEGRYDAHATSAVTVRK
jgi:hypothetical protein